MSVIFCWDMQAISLFLFFSVHFAEKHSPCFQTPCITFMQSMCYHTEMCKWDIKQAEQDEKPGCCEAKCWNWSEVWDSDTVVAFQALRFDSPDDECSKQAVSTLLILLKIILTHFVQQRSTKTKRTLITWDLKQERYNMLSGKAQIISASKLVDYL